MAPFLETLRDLFPHCLWILFHWLLPQLLPLASTTISGFLDQIYTDIKDAVNGLVGWATRTPRVRYTLFRPIRYKDRRPLVAWQPDGPAASPDGPPDNARFMQSWNGADVEMLEEQYQMKYTCGCVSSLISTDKCPDFQVGKFCLSAWASYSSDFVLTKSACSKCRAARTEKRDKAYIERNSGAAAMKKAADQAAVNELGGKSYAWE
ncbi:uncharacterized protein K452DRAFT_297903 [Aplosporella prunicola CBS 121167]|uniref:Uncharacterized protein n=1 Tax=Aplosporella prunicola CBS 121167 TaxID=1176127 RepID=A0A6A6BES1_9PEZI|nr:uncharacterized protein K452DRAFT_297903 [Aplosporella prunicola CBS 121167]KAF2142650.1 hypothetical protein K452DRAFT_297903 [Aplosporella prunicola CBS 121167]